VFTKKKNRVEVEGTGGGIEINAVNSAGEEVDTAVLEDAGVAFDPTTMHVDLSKDEKRRTTALMLSIQAYQHLIIKDADYLREAHAQARANDGPVIRPATMDAMVMGALQFDAFISGHLSLKSAKNIGRESQPEAPATPDESLKPIE
jgi:hypothetical protein